MDRRIIDILDKLIATDLVSVKPSDDDETKKCNKAFSIVNTIDGEEVLKVNVNFILSFAFTNFNASITNELHLKSYTSGLKRIDTDKWEGYANLFVDIMNIGDTLKSQYRDLYLDRNKIWCIVDDTLHKLNLSEYNLEVRYKE